MHSVDTEIFEKVQQSMVNICETDHKSMSGNIVEQKIHRYHLEAYLRYCNFIKQHIAVLKVLKKQNLQQSSVKLATKS